VWICGRTPIAEVTAERAAITARASATRTAANPDRKLSQEEIANIVQALTDIRKVIQHADPADKARVYKELGLRLTYDPAQHKVRAQVNLDPDNHGVMVCVRGPYHYLRTYNLMQFMGLIPLDPNAPKLQGSTA
jgi:site-specific DNA recombinase